MIALWAICGVAVFCLVQTKFHHYILPVVPALALLVAFFLDDILARRDRLHPLYAVLGIGIVLLVARDLMWEPERWIEMFVFRYDRPWPSDRAVGDRSVGRLPRARHHRRGRDRDRRPALAPRSASSRSCSPGSRSASWALQVLHADRRQALGHARSDPHATTTSATIYGEKLVYFGAREVADDWADVEHELDVRDDSCPTALHDRAADDDHASRSTRPTDERVMESSRCIVGTVTRIGDARGRAHVLPRRAREDRARRIARGKAKSGARSRPPVRAVDADRLIAWQLYWRGENFWSGDEIFGWLPEMKTAFTKTDNVEFLKYIERSHASAARPPLLPDHRGGPRDVAFGRCCRRSARRSRSRCSTPRRTSSRSSRSICRLAVD